MEDKLQEEPSDVIWRLGKKLFERREIEQRLSKLNAEIDADCSRLATVEGIHGTFVTGPSYNHRIVQLAPSLGGPGLSASLILPSESHDLAWPAPAAGWPGWTDQTIPVTTEPEPAGHTCNPDLSPMREA